MRNKAIYLTHPTVVTILNDEQAFDKDGKAVSLNEILIASKVEELEAGFNSTEYQRNREKEYPPLADLADALYWQAQGDETKMTAYVAKCEAVKQKYPKE
jgi:hypothetical protein